MPRSKVILKTDPVRQKRDQTKNRIVNSSLIISNGFIADFPCEHCRRNDYIYMISEDKAKCAAYTRRGRPCERRFHSKKEWNDLKNAEDKVKSELEEAETELEKVFMAQQELFAKVRRLRKQKDFLKERGMSMRSHNQKVLEILDSKNPPTDAEVAVIDAEIMQEQLESHVLTATSSSLDAWLANPEQLPADLMGVVGDTSLELPALPRGSQ
uniref:DNA repair protein RAD50 n=1 Tax=Talaromyces marneffei PM1 TaxID=1077442 RepID=A0A093UKB9_TALMA